MTYLYLKPEPTFKTGITGILLIILITTLSMNYLHLYLNWENPNIKCRVDNMFIAYITGSFASWWEKCAGKKSVTKITVNN